MEDRLAEAEAVVARTGRRVAELGAEQVRGRGAGGVGQHSAALHNTAQHSTALLYRAFRKLRITLPRVTRPRPHLAGTSILSAPSSLIPPGARRGCGGGPVACQPRLCGGGRRGRWPAVAQGAGGRAEIPGRDRHGEGVQWGCMQHGCV